MAFKLPSLPYGFDALEPFIDEATMRIHHDKHHEGYVEKLNKALENQGDLKTLDISILLANIEKAPEDIRVTVRNNAGGHANHSLFWEIMAPPTATGPKEKLSEAIDSTFGSYDIFVEKFSNTALSHFGSGWAWLVVNQGKLEIMSFPNQDSPLMFGMSPILGLDVWEHAYYLKYQNRRAAYIESWWNVVSWEKVEDYFNQVR